LSRHGASFRITKTISHIEYPWRQLELFWHGPLAAVVRRNEALLISRRPLGQRHGGLWEFPGGEVEFGESDYDAIRRELAAELAVQVTAVGAVEFLVQDSGSEFVIAFLPASKP